MPRLWPFFAEGQAELWVWLQVDLRPKMLGSHRSYVWRVTMPPVTNLSTGHTACLPQRRSSSERSAPRLLATRLARPYSKQLSLCSLCVPVALVFKDSLALLSVPSRPARLGLRASAGRTRSRPGHGALGCKPGSPGPFLIKIQSNPAATQSSEAPQ